MCYVRCAVPCRAAPAQLQFHDPGRANAMGLGRVLYKAQFASYSLPCSKSKNITLTPSCAALCRAVLCLCSCNFTMPAVRMPWAWAGSRCSLTSTVSVWVRWGRRVHCTPALFRETVPPCWCTGVCVCEGGLVGGLCCA